MDAEPISPLSSSEVALIDLFAASARAYCAFLDTAAGRPVGPFLRGAQAHLLELVRAAIDLPDIGPATEGSHVDLASKEAARIARSAFPSGLDNHSIYTHIFDPFEDPPEAPVGRDLRLDLPEIYEDVRSGLNRWEAGDEAERRDAAWDWRFGFVSHWGRHATEAIKAIHWLLFDQFIGTEDPV